MKLKLLSVVVLLAGCTHYALDGINYEVNGYGYVDDSVSGRHGVHPMSPTQKGDCEDYAYTKCLMIRLLYPDKDTFYLYRYGSPAHAALMVDGMVLDNQYNYIYPYVEANWTRISPWACENQPLGTNR
jgi:predicted transglutaminase-like cysteine proteinase